MLVERVDALRTAGRELTEPQATAVLRQAVEEVRHRPTPPRRSEPAMSADTALDPALDPALVAQGRALVEELYAHAAQIGAMALEIAPAHLSDAQATEPLFLFAEEIGDTLDEVMAKRRYAITGDRRALPFTPAEAR